MDNSFNDVACTRYGRMIYNRYCIWIGRSFAEYGEFSEGEVDLFKQIVKPDSVVLDIGANIGSHTIPFAQLAGANGVVLAFEPNRLNFQALCGNVAVNSLDNVYTYNVGCGAEAGSINVPRWDPRLPNNSGGMTCDGSLHGPSDPCELITIDQLNLPRVDFMKVDVEGMEADVLSGAMETIRRHRPLLYVENDRQEKSAGLLAVLRQLKYRAYWHRTALYNPENWACNPVNVFGGIGSLNMLCVPAEMEDVRLDGAELVE